MHTPSSRHVRAVAACALLLALLLSGCGSSSSNDKKDLLVSAATSLKAAFTDYGEGVSDANVQLSFAGSDELAAQIRSGARPAVFAAANTKLPDQLFKEGLVEKPQVFATNRLVLAVPAGGRISSIDDLTTSGTRIAIGSPSVPIGSYTRKVLARLDAATRKAILANVRSEEPDVGGISAKLTQKAVDAGFLYVTDVKATNGRLKAIELPARLQPAVAYGVAIVKGSKNTAAARTFVDGLLRGDGADALRRAGFEAPAT
ncbi:MAG: molybdate transport system substrate-binding protein [Solirubrobacteraceae bacterium]|nr:molybdate transport system substrate-binding protein [Solirubrobacteraceae bacterium]